MRNSPYDSPQGPPPPSPRPRGARGPQSPRTPQDQGARQVGTFPTWLLWVIGPVTILAIALIIVAVVLGVQAGQRQVEMQRIQQVGIAHQRAVDLRAEGRFAEARVEYERVLALDPNNSAAMIGLQELANIGEGSAFIDASQGDSGGSPGDGDHDGDGQTPPAAGASETQTAEASNQAPDPDAEQAMAQAVGAYQDGQWARAVDHLIGLQASAPSYQSERVKQMLFTAYVNLAATEDQAGNVSDALDYVDKALELRPDATELRTARSLVAQYAEAVELGDDELARKVALLQNIYDENPDYRDVEERLVQALLDYGDELADAGEPCEAMRQYQVSVEIEITPGSIFRRDTLESECVEARRLANAQIPTFTPVPGRVQPTPTPTPTPVDDLSTDDPSSVANGTDTNDTGPSDTGSNSVATGTDTTDQTTTGQTATSQTAAGEPAGGRLLYSAPDPVDGRQHVWTYHVGSGAAPSVMVENAQQPAMRPDGQRLAFRNLDEGARGIGTYDPATGLRLRFTDYAEDHFPSWNAEGNRVAFASNREGDRRWRIYQVWGDVDEQAHGIEYGTAPAYHPGMDRMAFRGCDETGNRCGLWMMSTAGGDRAPLTNVPADDRPAWSPNGGFAVFMSEARHGNMEIYRVEASSGEVTRLTDDPALDVMPAVSPDGQWVAFFSNRSGAWAVWAVPSSGGEAQMILELPGGLGGDWSLHGLEWIN